MAVIWKILRIKSTTLSDDLILCQVSKGSSVWSEFNIVCTLVTMATVAILNFLQPLKSCHTQRWIFLQSFMKFDERNPPKKKSLFFCFHGNCGKICLTDSNFFGLSRSNRCGFCSYQVSSISVRRVTCYDHLCFSFFYHFGHFHGNGSHFEKNQPLKNNFTWHMIFLQGFITFDQGISEKCVGQTFDGRKKEEE